MGQTLLQLCSVDGTLCKGFWQAQQLTFHVRKCLHRNLEKLRVFLYSKIKQIERPEKIQASLGA